MKKCIEVLIEHNVTCPCKKCRMWIDYKEDLNCTIVAAEKNGSMTLREVSDRLGISFVRVKQIQDIAHSKLLKRIGDSFEE